IEVGADREVAMMREPTRRLDVELAPSREMVDQHHARKAARTRRLGDISGNRGALVTREGHVLAGHASVECHSLSSISVNLGRPSVQRRASSSIGGGALRLLPGW